MRHATVEQLSAYLDAEVSERERRRVDEHLRGCESCRQRLAGLRSVAAGLRGLEAGRPPAELGYLVERQVAAAGPQQTLSERLESTARRLRLQPVLAPVFGVVLALAVILYLFAAGVARDRERPTRLIIGPSAGAADEGEPAAPAAAPRPPARVAAPLESREVAGRLFDRAGEWWVERGLPEGTEVERLEAVALDPEAAAALEPFRDLRRARLLHHRRVVEVIYPEPGERQRPPSRR